MINITPELLLELLDQNLAKNKQLSTQIIDNYIIITQLTQLITTIRIDKDNIIDTTEINGNRHNYGHKLGDRQLMFNGNHIIDIPISSYIPHNDTNGIINIITRTHRTIERTIEHPKSITTILKNIYKEHHKNITTIKNKTIIVHSPKDTKNPLRIISY